MPFGYCAWDLVHTLALALTSPETYAVPALHLMSANTGNPFIAADHCLGEPCTEAMTDPRNGTFASLLPTCVQRCG